MLAARETLRVIEQTVLLDAATAYMDVVRDAAILEVQRSNVQVLDETLRQTRRRFKLGEVTHTDVAQAEAQLAAGQSQMLGADSNLTTSKADYRRVIGSKPGRLEPGLPVDDLSPRTLAAAIDAGMIANPSVKAAMYGVDVARLQVKISEGALYPTVTLQGNVERAHDVTGLIHEQSSASVLLGVTIPTLPGRCRVLGDPPIKRDAGTTPARPRHHARSGARRPSSRSGVSSRPPRRRSKPHRSR